MFPQLALLSGLVLSVSCMVLHQAPIPVSLGLQYPDTPNYNFAYEVNDVHTGDIKNQHESRRGDTVLGQYSLLQPDGVRRVVDYRADEHVGFRATVNNQGRPIVNQNDQANNNVEVSRQAASIPVNPAYLWPAPATQTPPSAPAVAVSRSSIVQTFSSPVHAPIHGNQYSNQYINQYSNQYGNNNPWV